MKKLILLLMASLFLLSGCSQKSNKISVNNPYEIAKGTSVLSYYDTEDNIDIEGFTILECTSHNVFRFALQGNCIVVNNGMIRFIHIVDEDIITYKGISVGDSVDKIENSFEHERKIVQKDIYNVIFNNNIEVDSTDQSEDTWIVISYSTDGSQITSIEIFDVLFGNRLE